MSSILRATPSPSADLPTTLQAIVRFAVPAPPRKPMSTHTYPQGSDAVILSVILPADIGAALDQAAGECLASRAGHARRLLASALRESGHLAPLTPSRRYRAARRLEAAQ